MDLITGGMKPHKARYVMYILLSTLHSRIVIITGMPGSYWPSGTIRPGPPGRALSSVQPPVSPALYSLQHGPKLPTDKLRNITGLEYSMWKTVHKQ